MTTYLKAISLTMVTVILSSLTACQTTEVNQALPVEAVNHTTNDTTTEHHDDMIICTMQYDPVCASVKDANGAITQKTFGNSCTTQHAKGQVISMTKGECE